MAAFANVPALIDFGDMLATSVQNKIKSHDDKRFCLVCVWQTHMRTGGKSSEPNGSTLVGLVEIPTYLPTYLPNYLPTFRTVFSSRPGAKYVCIVPACI